MSKNWAICIGINDYYNRLAKLQYAVCDANAVKEFFLSEVNFERVFYFAVDAPPIETENGLMRSEPTYANLINFLGQLQNLFQRRALSVGDNFWFFFAGHGQLHNGHDYLMPIDVDPDNLEKTALKLSDITAILRNSGADNTMLLLDACRRTEQRGAEFGSEAQPGIVTLYSCSPSQSAYEIEELEHGAFTYALLKGFRQQGTNSCATVQRIDQYLRDEVPKLNKLYDKPVQTPYTAVEPLAKSYLILLPKRARLEDVQVLKNEAYKAEIENNLEFADQLWMRIWDAGDQDAAVAIRRIAVKQVQQMADVSQASTATAGTRSISEPTEAPVVEPVPLKESPPAPPPAPTFSFEVVQVDARGSITQREQRSAEYRREDLGQGITLDLVKIPGGTFQMGSEERNTEKPPHQVTVKPFLLGKYPVTQAQWQAVAALPKIKQDLEPAPSRFQGKDRPVERVSWDDAVEFCQRLSKHSNRPYRLPSEAEWEYACRANTTTPFCFGDTLTAKIANYDATKVYGSGPKGEYRQSTIDVGSFPANNFGLYDMHGNVWEWCQDHWHENYEGAPTDESAWETNDISESRLLRGGSWGYDPVYCRSANRYGYARDNRNLSIGFRVVCSALWTLA